MLMTVDQWQRKTSRVLRDRKNPLVTDIDILLGAFHEANKTDLQKLKIVVLIRRYCRDWLAEKADKRSCFRRPHVQELLDQTTAVMNWGPMQAAMTQRRAGGSQAMPGRQMQENIVETLQPRPQAKQKFGLAATLPMNRSSAGNAEQRAANWNMVHPNDQVDEHDVVSMLDMIGDANQRNEVKNTLVYMQRADRLACRLELRDGLFYRGADGDPHNSPGERELYAIDNAECIYTNDQPAKAGTFHHSSFLSGKPVLCAGELRVQNGRIVHIDNLSGHYLPTTQHLLDCVALLERRYNIDLRRVSLADMARPDAKWPNALQFLRQQGQPAAWRQARPQGGLRRSIGDNAE